MSHPLQALTISRSLPSETSLALRTSNTNQQPRPLKKFHLFPLLPPELRLKIYDHIHAFSSPAPRIVTLCFSLTTKTFLSTTAPPLVLGLCGESRTLLLGKEVRKVKKLYGAGTQSKAEKDKETSQGTTKESLQGKYTYIFRDIPVNLKEDILYLSGLQALVAMGMGDILWCLGTTPARPHIHNLAIDLRVWSDLVEGGLLGVLARMRSLKSVRLVVEFGRGWRGDVGFLEAPPWRQDLNWLASHAGDLLEEERKRVSGGKGEGLGKVDVRCVILTRGGEQA